MQWHETFAGSCPYKIIGFSAADHLLLYAANPIGTTFYALAPRSGEVAITWHSKISRRTAGLCISPGGKYLAAFNRGELHIWNIIDGKLAGESNVTIPKNLQANPCRLAFSPGGSRIAAEITGNFSWKPGYDLLTWNANNGKLIAHATYKPQNIGFGGTPAQNSFGCISNNSGWQIGLKMIDAATGRIYHRFANPVRENSGMGIDNMFAWMPDNLHLLCAAGTGSQWGYMILKADDKTIQKQLASIRVGELRNDWKLGPLNNANTGKCARITLPNTAPTRWSFSVPEPTATTTRVPVRIVATRLLTIQQGGVNHLLRFDSIHFSGAKCHIALVAYRQFDVNGPVRPTAFWIDRINLRTGAILGSFASPTPGARLLDFSTNGKTMLLSTHDTVDIYN